MNPYEKYRYFKEIETMDALELRNSDKYDLTELEEEGFPVSILIEPREVLISIEQKEVNGIIVYEEKEENLYYIHNIFIEKVARTTGIAYNLMSEAFSKLKPGTQIIISPLSGFGVKIQSLIDFFSKKYNIQIRFDS